MEQRRFNALVPHKTPTLPKVKHGFKYDGPDDFEVPDLRVSGRTLARRPYQIKQGMHGIIERVEPMRSLVQFLNFRDTSLKNIMCWLPNSLIVVGEKPWTGHFDIAYRHDDFTVPDVTNEDMSRLDGDIDTIFSKYLRTCMATDSPWMPPDFLRDLGPDGQNIGNITHTVMKALSNTGAYNVLDNHRLFDMSDLKSKCPVVNETMSYLPEFVIYFILYEDPDGKTHLCVGKTRDLVHRLATYRDATNNKKHPNHNGYHHRLRRKCGSKRHMGILARFNNESEYNDHSAITEQFMVSCLRTYRPTLEALAEKVRPEDLLVSYGSTSQPMYGDEIETAEERRERAKGVEHYMLFTKIAQTAFHAAGYANGVGVRNFGVNFGVNWDSPLPEAHFLGSYESTLWIKQVQWLADEGASAPLTTYRLANFVKSRKNYANWFMCHNTEENNVKRYWYQGTFFTGPYEKGADHKKLLVIDLQTPACAAGDSANDAISDKNLPKQNTEYVTSIEVLEDFNRQHPYSFTRLQGIDAWEDSLRAKSFAVRIDWVDDDGKPKYRYLQYSFPSSCWRDEDPMTGGGSQTAYDIGIALSHWQYGDPIQKLAEKASWQRECASQMLVKVKEYDPLTWSVTFDNPRPLKTVPSEARISETKQEKQMQEATYKTQLGPKTLLSIDRTGTRSSLMEEPQKPGERHK